MSSFRQPMLLLDKSLKDTENCVSGLFLHDLEIVQPDFCNSPKKHQLVSSIKAGNDKLQKDKPQKCSVMIKMDEQMVGLSLTEKFTDLQLSRQFEIKS